MTLFLYAYWTKEPKHVVDDYDNPIWWSIKTLLRFNPDARVVVFDYSEGKAVWPTDLPFQLIQKPIRFEHRPWCCAWTLSKAFDTTEYADTASYQNVVIADADLLWLRTFEPQQCPAKKLSVFQGNTGCVYYQPGCQAIDRWRQVMSRCYDNEAYSRQVVEESNRLRCVRATILTEERALVGAGPEHIYSPGLWFNGIVPLLAERPLPDGLLNLHLMHNYASPQFRRRRGLIVKNIKEFGFGGKVGLREFISQPINRIVRQVETGFAKIML